MCSTHVAWNTRASGTTTSDTDTTSSKTPSLPKPEPARGLFITFEGIDGCGKTTQAKLLGAALEARGLPVCLTREPGGTDLGQSIRQMLLGGPSDLDSRTEALLYAADRAYHVETVVRPALQAGKIVVQDRYIDSSLAYQGAGRSLKVDEVCGLSAWATNGLWPDLTFVFDLSAKAARERLHMRSSQSQKSAPALDRLEEAGLDFQDRVRVGFLELARKHPERIHVLNAADSKEKIHENVLQIVLGKLQRTDVSPTSQSHELLNKGQDDN